MIEQEERLLRCAQSVVHTREPLLLFVSAGVWQARGEEAGRRGGKVWTREEMKCIMSGGAKRRRKKGKSPAKEMKWSRGEKHGRICTHLRVQICAGKCIRAEINCLLMNMCREFDLIFQM